jgi:hypothetical protein
MIPWHRVINAQGKLSLEEAGASSGLTQRLRLQQEGVVVNAGGRVDLKRYGWEIDANSSREKRVVKKTSAKKKTATPRATKKVPATKKVAPRKAAAKNAAQKSAARKRTT